MTIDRRSAKKNQAISLRKRGFSLSEISKKMNISKSTASLWLRGVIINKNGIKRLGIIKEKAHQKSSQTRSLKKINSENLIAKQARAILVKINVLDNNTKKLQLAILYGCEGAKTDRDGRLTFVNSDAQLMVKFIQLLREEYDIDESKFRGCLHLHAYHDKKTQLRYWSNLLSISEKQFSIYHKKNTRKRIRDNYQGCLSLRYYDSRIAKELYYLYRAYLGV